MHSRGENEHRFAHDDVHHLMYVYTYSYQVNTKILGDIPWSW